MWMIHLWMIVVLIQFEGGGSKCVTDLLVTRYSGTVSVTNNGHTCQAWSSQTPHSHGFNDDGWFPDDGSVTAARNFCRSMWDHGPPWCFTTHPDIRWGYCDFSICADHYQECGKVLKGGTGSVTAPDFDGDGLYDTNVDCLWTILAPEDYVIRYLINFFEIEDSNQCLVDALMIFEKGRTERLSYCGSMGSNKMEGETESNILYIHLYSDFSVTKEGFNITYRQLKAPKKDCGGVLSQNSGSITSPDRDGDGLYDFNLNCSWIIEADENKVIAFWLLFMDIMASECDCEDHLLIHDTKISYIGYGDYVLPERSDVIKTTSNVMFVRFYSDHINARSGFKLEYEQASARCLDDLTGYSGTVSVTNHGQTCQAWSSQTPHPHSHNQDSLFPVDGSVTEASNYCRDIDKPGRPWCYTVDQNIIWSYCTFRICNISTGPCGGLIENNTGTIISRALLYQLEEFDCLWTIQADKNHVIKYNIIFDEKIDHNQCQAHVLIFFEKGDPLQERTFCGSLYLYFDGETRSNLLNVRYYKERTIHPISFYLFFEHTEEREKYHKETLRDPAGWIVSPDRDGDNLYDFNIHFAWKIVGNSSSVILLTPIYIILEFTPDCSSDFIAISDNFGPLFYLCGFRNNTEADTVKSRLNHLFIEFKTNGIISARGFNFSYEILSRDDDCLTNLLHSNYSGTVSVTNNGITCQAWISQTPHSHDLFMTDDTSAWKEFNYCRNFDALAPWCFTMDPYIRWQYCTYSICNGTVQKCEEVLQSRTGVIVSPDYDEDGLYDLNVDCLWIVEAPEDYVIQFDLNFVYIESSTYCIKDLLQIFEKIYLAGSRYICGQYEDSQSGETRSNALYVQFYSDSTIQSRGFNISYTQIEATLVPDKDCTEILRNKSGWIRSPDNDGDGFYDFNLNCFWTVEVDPGKLIRFQLLYVDLDFYYVSEDLCQTDKIMVHDDFGALTVICGISGNMIPGETMETRSNVMYVRFTSDNIISARGFNLTFVEFERNNDCFDDLKSVPYSGTVSVTNNGLQCQAWSEQTPHNHSENRDTLFPTDGSVSKAKNYCRDVWGDGRPWCYTTDKDIRMGFCTLRICNENIQSCGGVLHSTDGIIVPPDSNNDGFYDLNVDCLWTIVVSENGVIRHKIDDYWIEDSSECHKDALRIHESGVAGWSTFCGIRTEKLEGETLSNKLYIHFYSDESVAFQGFQLTFIQKEVSKLPCGGTLKDNYGWITAPDRDEDGLYDFNLNCLWTVEVPQQQLIKYQVQYVKLDPCDEDSDYLKIYEEQIDFEHNVGRVYCGTHQIGGIRVTKLSILYIQFVSNNLDVGQGFRIAYEQDTAQRFLFPVTGDGWIRSLDLNGDGKYDNLVESVWSISAPEKTAIELEIYFLKTEGLYPFCTIADILRIVYRLGHTFGFEEFCGTIGRQAVIQSHVNYAVVHFYSDYKYNDVGFVIAYKQINASRTRSLTTEFCPGWISSLDTDLNGLYEYHAHLEWIITADDTNNNILLNLLYIDVEDSRGCKNDLLAISHPDGYYAMVCGVGFKKIFTVLSNNAYIFFGSDHTINRFGFNMSFLQIAGVMKYECNVVLTDPSRYIMSIDVNGDGQYDSGQDCLWTIRLGYTKVVVFEVLKQDIHQPAKSSKCEDDVLEIIEDHRKIGKFCGKDKAPRFTTEANILFVRFLTGLMRSGKGFEAVYFQAEDEKHCLSDYKCLLTQSTIQKEFICDTFSDCPYSDDERFCDFRCPQGCICTGLSVDCTGRYDCGFNKKPSSMSNQTFILSSTTRILDISTNHEMFLYLNLEGQDLVFLSHLNLSSCEITDLPVNTFLSMKRLKVLDISFNKIRQLKGDTFLNQATLETLLLRGNSEPLIIETGAFVGLVSLQYLDLSTLQIERISKVSFATLQLKELSIFHSHILEMESLSLDKLYVEFIYFNSSTIDTFTETMFHGGTGTYMFVTDEYKHCCIRPVSVKEENCYPQKDEFSSCDDLIKYKILRPLAFVIGLLSFFSNAISVVYRCRYHSEQLKFCYGIAAMHLAVSDSLLGLYLILIGITDNIFRGRYIFHDESWRGSAWCQLAGVLSTVSCEASVLFSCLITADRLLVIKYPFGQKRLTRGNATVLAIVFWSFALFLAVLPVTLPSYFKGEFYSQSGLCLALPLTRARQSGWAYAVGIFIIFNSLACLLIAIGQWKIYSEIKASKKTIGDRRSKSTNDGRIARNLLLVVTTNFLCWLPVEFLGVMALADYPIPVNVYSWIAVVVLPINSAVNPVLYTLSEMRQKKKRIQYSPDFEKTEYGLTAGDLGKCTGLWNTSAFWTIKGQAPGFTSLTEVLQEEWFCRKERLCVAIDICRLLHKLHDWKITQENLTSDDIFIKKTNQQRCKVALLCRPQQMQKVPDQDDNMLSLGLVLSTLIKEA